MTTEFKYGDQVLRGQVAYLLGVVNRGDIEHHATRKALYKWAKRKRGYGKPEHQEEYGSVILFLMDDIHNLAPKLLVELKHILEGEE